MAEADSNRFDLLWVRESTFKTAPTGTYETARLTGESLKGDTETVKSGVMRADRNTAGIFRTGVGASGDTQGELAFSEWDDWLEAALQSATWGGQVALSAPVGTDLTFGTTGQVNTITRTAGSWITDGILKGAWIEVTTAGESANNGYRQVYDVTASVLTVSGSAFTTDANDTAAAITMPDYIKNATTLITYTLDKKQDDVTQYERLTGMAIDGTSIVVPNDNLATISFSWLGALAQMFQTAAGSGANAASSNVAYSGVANVPAFSIGNVSGTVSLAPTQMTFAVANNLRRRQIIGTLGALSIGSGLNEVSGAVQAYLQDEVLMDHYLNFDTLSIGTALNESNSGHTLIGVPNVKFTSGQKLNSGQSQDVMVDLTYEAFVETSQSIDATIFIQRA